LPQIYRTAQEARGIGIIKVETKFVMEFARFDVM